ncbi:MAG: hypothetical protein AAB421_01865 [Patescibacteria group bacterium]
MIQRYGSSFVVGFGVGIVVLAIAGFVWGSASGKWTTQAPDEQKEVTTPPVRNATSTTENSESAPALLGKPIVAQESTSLTVNSQQAGGVVKVDEVHFQSAGWLVVHEIVAGHVGNALGAARLDTGVHTAVAIELLRATEPAKEYIVIVYADNGNKEFDIRGDLPVLDAEGNPVMSNFKTTVSVENSEPTSVQQ